MLPVNNNYSQSMAASAMNTNQRLLQLSLEKISTGNRINRADDDPAGLRQLDTMASQLFGMEEGITNIQVSTGMAQVAEEGMNQMTDSLQRIRTLPVRAADSSVSDDEREGIQVEVDSLMREINQRASQTTYNGVNLFDGRAADSGGQFQVQTGANEGQTSSWGPVKLDASVLFKGRPEEVTVKTVEQAQSLISKVDDALGTIGRENAQVGSFANELNRTLDLQRANYSSMMGGYSTIGDTNMAEEATRSTSNSIQNQAAAAVLAQANSNSQYILKLFQ